MADHHVKLEMEKDGGVTKIGESTPIKYERPNKFHPNDFYGLCWGITGPEQFKEVVCQRANELLPEIIAPLKARIAELEKQLEDLSRMT